MVNPFSIQGKRILVVGEESALNSVLVGHLSNLGADVVVSRTNTVAQVESDIAQLSAGISFDGFVFATMHSDFRPIKFLKPEIVAESINDNFALFVESVRSLLKGRLLKDGASIVAMSSISSFRAQKTKTAFCAAKAALDSAVRCLALELGDKGIRVNSVQKGATDADFSKEHIQTVTVLNDNATEKKQVLRTAKAEEVVNAVAFLLCDATPTMTGTSIVVDGGYTL